MAGNIFWYKETPPINQAPFTEDVVEGSSKPIPYRFGENEPWADAYDNLRATIEARLQQELLTHQSKSAHVVHEKIHSKIDHTNETYHLEGAFGYVLYR